MAATPVTFRLASHSLALALALIGALYQGAAAAAAVNWVPNADGFWDEVTNWSSNPALPGAADNVTINVGGATVRTITHQFGTDTVNSLASQENFALTGGSLSLNAASTINASFTQSGGTLGGTGQLTINGTGGTWTGGTMDDTGTTRIAASGDLTLSGNTFKVLDHGRTLTNAGTVNWSTDNANNGVIFTGNAATINNNGTWKDLNTVDNQISNGLGGADSTFNNSGTYAKSGAGNVFIGLAFNNTGMVKVDAGTLSLSNGGTDTSGDYTGAGTIEFSGGTHTSDATSTLTVANVTFSGGTMNFAGTYNTTGTTTVNGGTANLTGTLTSLGSAINISGGTLNPSGSNAAVGSYTQSGGTLGGTGQLTINGTGGTWTGGTMDDTGTTRIAASGDLTLSGNTFKVLDHGRTLTNAGTVNWSTDNANNGVIFTGNAATINNNGTWKDLNTVDNQISNGLGGADSTFNNSGTYTKSGASNTSISIGFSNTGSVDVQGGTLELTGDATQHVADTLTGGKWIVSGNGSLNLNEPGAVDIVTNQGDVTLNGAAASFARINTLTNNQGAFRLLGNRNFTAVGAFANSGKLQLAGGTFAAPGLTNTNTGEVFGFGNVSPRPTNQGLVRAADGILSFANGISGTGKVQIDPGATLDLSAGSQGSNADQLIHNGAGLNLGTHNFDVATDYTNANFGVGNSFNARANVTGTGLIRATGNTAQALTGQVTNGTSATPSLAFGNIHLGDAVTKKYQVANTGSTGPSLRGALQTSVNGGNLTDARLSGSGVTASNFGPLATGANSGDLAVTLTGSSAGAVTGQKVAIVNNFDNVAEQVFSFSGAVFRLSAANVIQAVQFGNVHVGDVVNHALSLTNTAANDGFSEKLNAAFGAVSDGRIQTSGAVNQLGAGATDNSSLVVGLDTSTAGRLTGFATIKLTSDGVGTSGLGLTTLSSQNVGVTTNIAVYRLASAAIQNALPINFGAFRVGDAAGTVDLAVKNTAANDGFSEGLNASAGAVSAGFTATGSFNLLTAGATNTGSIKVGLDTTVAGNKSGTAGVNLVSDGAGTSNLGQSVLAAQSVNVRGKVYAKAVAEVQTASVDFGIVHKGDAVAAKAITVKNAATGALSDTLLGTIATVPTGFSGNGTLGANGLAAGATDIANLNIGLNTAAAGIFNGNAALAFASHDPDLSDLSLLGQNVALTAQVNNFAKGKFELAGGAGGLTGSGLTFTLNFGTLVRGTGTANATLRLLNDVSGPADTLAGNFDLSGLGAFGANGFTPFTGITAGATLNSLTVSFDAGTLATGDYFATVLFNGLSQNTSGFSGALAPIALKLQGHIEASVVPVPAAVWMLGSGVFGLCAMRRRIAV